ncbi:unnamed protein product [Urochloa humidicola]
MEPRDGEFMDKALVLSPATQAGGARFAAMGLVEAAGPGHSGVVAASEDEVLGNVSSMKTANSLQLATAQASLDRGTSSSSHVIPTGLPAFYLNVEVAMDIIPGREKDGEGVEADAGSVGMNGPYVEANIGR